MAETLPPPIAAEPTLKPVIPPPGSPDAGGSRFGADAGGGATKAAAKTPPPVEALDFLDPMRRVRTVTLDHPFRLDGTVVETVTIRRLLTQEVAAWRDTAGEDADDYGLFALMTGLPEPVLRGLDSDDGTAVMAAAFDFLPRWLRPPPEPAASASAATPASGEATPRT